MPKIHQKTFLLAAWLVWPFDLVDEQFDKSESVIANLGYLSIVPIVFCQTTKIKSR